VGNFEAKSILIHLLKKYIFKVTDRKRSDVSGSMYYAREISVLKRCTLLGPYGAETWPPPP
jgi:hypothetical protein